MAQKIRVIPSNSSTVLSSDVDLESQCLTGSHEVTLSQSSASLTQNSASLTQSHDDHVFSDKKSQDLASNILLQHKKNTVRFFLVFFGISVSFTAVLATFMIVSRTTINSIFQIDFQLTEYSKNIKYYDEVLTMSARMAAFTGKIYWVERYMQYVEPIDNDIKAVAELMPDIADIFFESTDLANQKLIEFETLALNIVNSSSPSRNLTTAQNYVIGPEYNAEKEILLEGLDILEQEIQQSIMSRQRSIDAYSLAAVICACVILFLSISLGIGIMRMIRIHTVDEEKQLFKAMTRYYNMKRHEKNKHGAV